MKRTKLIKIFILFLFTIIYCNAIFAGYYDDIDWVSKSYKDGEPDYSDGDLEDKLGDSGYYYDLFPEERDGEPDDYNPSSKSRGNYNSNFEINDNFIRNMKDIRTRQYRVIGAITVNGKIYYKNNDGSFHTGWKEELGKWYYFDHVTLVLVMYELRDINGKVYYLKPNGVMACDETFTISGIKIHADKDGGCSIVE